MHVAVISLSLLLSPSPTPPTQSGDAPLPVNTQNDIHEFHCIQAYLVSDNCIESLRIQSNPINTGILRFLCI